VDILIEEYQNRIWSAALVNGRLEGVEVDPAHEAVRWGSVYWAKVKRVDAGLDAVFVELDEHYDGILYNKDVRVRGKDGAIVKGGDKAIGKMFKPGDMVAVQAKAAYLPRTHDFELAAEQKSAQMSMDIAIPGRHLIYCPMMDANRISSRIRKPDMRKALQTMLDALDDGMKGFILRSSAADLQTDIIVREAKILKSIWGELQKFFEGNESALIMAGPDSIQRILSDKAVEPIERIEVVTMDHYKQVEEWCSVFAPDLVPRVVPIELKDAAKDLALFEYRDVLGQIEGLFQDYALLPGGGNLIVQETVALTAIDINKGGDKRSRLAVNVEAAQEIARQVRLRNLGGIIIIDFLKMHSRKEQDELIRALEKSFDGDPCTVQIHGLTSLGLMEVTRKRRTPPLSERLEGFNI
jgi:ribonuclease G